MAQGDAGFARDQVGVEHLLTPLQFERSFEGPQRGHTTTACNLEPNMSFANREGQRAIQGVGSGRLERGDSQRKTDWLQFGRAQCLLEKREMIFGNANQQRLLFASRWMTARGGIMQSGYISRETAFGFQLQETGDVGLGQVRHIDMSRERPFQRQTHNAMALTNSGGVQMIADLAPDQLRIGG